MLDPKGLAVQGYDVLGMEVWANQSVHDELIGVFGQEINVFVCLQPWGSRDDQ